MADLRFDYKNNQKKKTSVFASGLIGRDNTATEADILFTLPKEVLITSCHVVIVDTGVALDKLDITIGGVAYGNITDLSAAGVESVASPLLYSHTGGEVAITPTLAGACSYRVVLEYVELDVTDGTYTD